MKKLSHVYVNFVLGVFYHLCRAFSITSVVRAVIESRVRAVR